MNDRRPELADFDVSNRSDEDLLNGFYAGDDEAYRELHNRYRPSLVRTAHYRLSTAQAGRQELAEDFADEALYSIVRSKQSLNIRCNTQRGRVAPWLFRILHNRVNSYLRSPRSRQRVASDFGITEHDLTMNTFGRLATNKSTPKVQASDNDELLSNLRSLVNHLPDELQAAVQFKYWDSLSNEEIAARLGVSPVTVWRRLTTAHNFLRDGLGESVLSA